jgi:hypothetical protein
MLPSAGTIVTTVSGAKRIGGKTQGIENVQGLEPWAISRLEAPGRQTIEITATPCRHGPAGSHLLIGDVIGFALKWDGQEDGGPLDIR